MKSDDIIVILGAGASCDAGLLSSLQMTRTLEEKINNSREWKKYKQLYYAIKSSIFYGHNLKGGFSSDLNVEELVNVLTELARCDEHTLYPFIASWNMELQKYGGIDFEHVKKFKELIVKELVNKWVNLRNNDKASYYLNLKKFAEEKGTNLRVFSLNYDLCVERVCGNMSVHRGFQRSSDSRMIWDDRIMLDDTAIQEPIRLYKLHGSLDWRRDDKFRLICEDNPDPCDNAEEYQLIFGTAYKLRYEDPFLFLISSLRQYALDAKLIICIGYSFSDEHINAILSSSFKRDEDTRIIAVTKAEHSDDDEKRIVTALEIDSNKLTLFFDGAKDFMENYMNFEEITKLFPQETAPF